MRLGSVEGQELMWWLTYRRCGKASGVVLIEAPSLDHARTQASLVDAHVDFAEGYELDAALAAVVPVHQVGRMLTIEETRQLLERFRRRGRPSTFHDEAITMKTKIIAAATKQ